MCAVLLQITKPYPEVSRSESEKHFKTKKGKERFPSLDEKCSINLSIVVPAYDEEKRCNDYFYFPAPSFLFSRSILFCLFSYTNKVLFTVPPMLDEALEFLENRQQKNKTFSYEVIIVSDGSKDKTVEVATAYSSKYGSNFIRVLDLQPNRGKGGAVRLVSRSCNYLVLYHQTIKNVMKLVGINLVVANFARAGNAICKRSCYIVCGC